MEFEKAPFWLKRKYSGPAKMQNLEVLYEKMPKAKLKHLFVLSEEVL
jgi:hypothetical protein